MIANAKKLTFSFINSLDLKMKLFQIMCGKIPNYLGKVFLKNKTQPEVFLSFQLKFLTVSQYFDFS